MSKPFKIIAGLLLVLLAAPLLALLLFDPNDFKDEIREQVATATGRELDIAGDLSLSFFPWLGLEIQDVSLANAPGFGDEPLARVARARVRVRSFPLLSGHLEMDRIRIEGLSLYLIRDQEGRANWNETAGAPATVVRGEQPAVAMIRFASWTPGGTQVGAHRVSAQESAAPQQVEGEDQPFISDFSVAGIEVVDSLIVWDDRQSGLSLTFEGLELVTGSITPGDPVDVRLSGKLENGTQRMQAQLAAETRVMPRGELDGFDLDPLKLRIESLLTADGLDAKGELKARLEGDTITRRYLISGLEVRLRLAGDALEGGHVDVETEARVALDLGAGTLDVEGLEVRSGTLAAKGGARGHGLLTTPVYEGHLALDELDLRAWLEQGGLPIPRTADTQTLGRASLKTAWRLDTEHLELQELALTLDQTLITGVVQVLRTEPPGYRVELVADQLNLDRYLPPGSLSRPAAGSSYTPLTANLSVAVEQATSTSVVETPEVAVPAAEAPASVAIDNKQPAAVPASAPIAVPQTARSQYLDLEGRLLIEELGLAGLSFGDASLDIWGRDWDLGAANQIGRFYEGRLEGSLGLDLRGADPGITLVQQGYRVQIGALIADLTGDTRLSGSGNFEANLTASGLDADSVKRSLAGTLAIQVAAGTIRGFNLERAVREADARLQGRTVQVDIPLQTDFRDLSATAQVQDGVLLNQDLTASSDHLQVTGRGEIDIVEEGFDYLFEPMFVNPPSGRGIKELEDIPIPVLLTGTFDQPRWDLDISAALRRAGKQELENRLKEDGGKIFEQLEERSGIKGLGRSLRGLLGQ